MKNRKPTEYVLSQHLFDLFYSPSFKCNVLEGVILSYNSKESKGLAFYYQLLSHFRVNFFSFANKWKHTEVPTSKLIYTLSLHKGFKWFGICYARIKPYS